jgi:hypothetical protein
MLAVLRGVGCRTCVPPFLENVLHRVLPNETHLTVGWVNRSYFGRYVAEDFAVDGQAPLLFYYMSGTYSLPSWSVVDIMAYWQSRSTPPAQLLMPVTPSRCANDGLEGPVWKLSALTDILHAVFRGLEAEEASSTRAASSPGRGDIPVSVSYPTSSAPGTPDPTHVGQPPPASTDELNPICPSCDNEISTASFVLMGHKDERLEALHYLPAANSTGAPASSSTVPNVDASTLPPPVVEGRAQRSLFNLMCQAFNAMTPAIVDVMHREGLILEDLSPAFRELMEKLMPTSPQTPATTAAPPHTSPQTPATTAAPPHTSLAPVNQ